MKTTSLLLFLVIPILGFSQKQINNYLSIEKTEKGYVFASSEGKKSNAYTYIYDKGNGFFEAVTVLPVSDSIRKIRDRSSNRCYTDYGNVTHTDLYIFDLMYELGTIESPPFFDGGDKWVEVKNYEANYGFARRNGKFAMVSKKGDFLTDFKYNGDAALNSYVRKGKSITVILDKCTGEELFSTKDSIVRYWDAENYLLKHHKKYVLTYQSKKHKVSAAFADVKDLPVESTLFTTSGMKRKILDSTGKEVKSELDPLSNFYKGCCIVRETTTEKPRKNYYGEWLAPKSTTVTKIVNDKWETVKMLDGILPSISGFNKYGGIIMEDAVGFFVMDYKGNYIIPPPKYGNRITEVSDGLYDIRDYNNIQGDEGYKQTNFYNQRGEKLLQPGWEKSQVHFYESKGINYLMYSDHVILKLDKENNIVERVY